MEILQRQRKDIDALEVDTVSMAIDSLKGESDFSVDLLDCNTITYCNWYRGITDNSINKEVITHNDKIVFSIDSDDSYSQKNITKVILHFECEVEGSLIFKNIGLNGEYTIIETTLNDTVNVDEVIDISEFTQEDLNSLICDKGFDISIVLDYNNINTSVKITSVKLTYECQDKLQSEIEVINNRFDPLQVYPVGSIYMSVNSTSPSTLFGGSWEKLEDTFLLGSGTKTVNTTGGSADAVVVSHTHTQESHRHSMGNLWNDGSGLTSAYVGTTNHAQKERYTDYQKPTINATGEDGTGKNMPPYLVVNIWKRIL